MTDKERCYDNVCTALLPYTDHTGIPFLVAEEAIIDLLADLMHFCDYDGHDFDGFLRSAREHFDAETA